MHGSIKKRSPLRVLLLSSRHRFEAENKRDLKLFSKMARALEQAGLAARHRSIRFERDLYNEISFEEPNVVLNALCIADHTIDQVRSIQRIIKERGYACIGTDFDTLNFIDSLGDLQERWRSLGIRSPSSFSVRRSQDGSIEGMEYAGTAIDFPYAIRPDNGIESRRERYSLIAGSSAELRRKIPQLFRRFDRILVQQCLDARRDTRFFCVARIGNGERQVLMPLELHIAKGMLFQSVTARDFVRNRASAEPISDKGTKNELLRLARAALDAAEVRDFARLDVILVDGEFVAVDLKAQPRVPDPIFDACASIGGLDEDQRTIAIFIAGFARLFLEGSAFIAIPPGMRASLPTPLFSILYG